MIKISADIISERWDDLPFELREFILSDDLINAIDSICEANGIADSSEIYRLTNVMLYGLLTADGFYSSLSELLGPEKSKTVFDAIKNAIPENIKEIIPVPPSNLITPSFSSSENEAISESAAPLPSPQLVSQSPADINITPSIPVSQIKPEPVIPQPEITIQESAIPSEATSAPVPVTAVTPQTPAPAAPFMLHQESEFQAVGESSGRFSPLRPSFYEPNIEEMREEKPAFARLQFGSSANNADNSTPMNPKITSPSTLKPSLKDGKEPVSPDNVVNLRDLPL